MRYRVADHVLDLRKFELRKHGRVVPVEPQVLSLLFLLVENRDRLVTKDELVEAIWAGRAVSDSAISSRIKSARQLLGDDGEAQRLIRTVHGRGFRFVGEVSTEETERADGRPAGALVAAAPPAEPRKRRLLLTTLGLGMLLLIGLLTWRPWQSGPVTIAVMPATVSPDSAALARDLTAKLAMLSDVKDGAARLLDRGERGRSDLRFEVDASATNSGITGNVTLLNRSDELLWSKDFQQPRITVSDLKQRLVFTAGKALDCALDTIGKGQPRLEQQLVKLYLNACAESADAEEGNIPEIERTFRKVVDAAPRFRPGWKRLLLAEAAMLDNNFHVTKADVIRARQTLAAAQKVTPSLPESYILQAETTTPTAMAERMRLVQMAVQGAPDDANVAATESTYLLKVGRLKEAVAAATRAVRNDPLSPINREAVIFALGYDGRQAEAEQALRDAEALWTNASTLRTARFTYYLRFADPKQAMRLRDSGLPMPSMSPFVGSFLTARANPTPANVELALRDARALYARTPIAISHLSQTLGAFHREEELFPILLNWQYPDKVDLVTDVLFRPALSNFRHDPRFMRVAARFGLLEYWRSSGNWPDFCFDADLPYDCKKVAAAVTRGEAILPAKAQHS
jgi:DNA-binding winged helix-turn-helix (wHTH) protein/tetratricopeptide (TPR) repeat protein